MTGMFWSIHYGGGIAGAGAEAAATRSSAQARSAKEHVRMLEDRLDHLTLVSMALWSLLREKTGLTEEDLMQRVQAIDLQDGKLDGKLAKETAKCPKCDRVMSPRHHRCIYCGQPRSGGTAFEKRV